MRVNIGAAIDSLQAPLTDERVHESRRALKRARTELRLVRATIGDANYLRANRSLRDVARALAPRRDAKALLEVCDAVAKALPTARHQRTLRRIRPALAAHHGQLINGGLRAQRAEAARLRRRLELSLERSRHWPAVAIEGEALAQAAGRLYRRGRQSLEIARRRRTAAALHEWRKHSKYLAEALASLGGGRGLMLDKLAKKVSRLVSVLGDHHDLHRLAGSVRAEMQQAEDPQAEKKLQASIVALSRDLERRAFRSGERLYRRSPRAFEARLGEALLKRQ